MMSVRTIITLSAAIALGFAAALTLPGQTPPTPLQSVAPGTVSKIVDPKLLTHVELGLHIHGIVKDPITGDVYVSDWSFKRRWNPLGTAYLQDDSIRRITPSGKVKRIADISRPNGMVFNPKNNTLYVATGAGGCLGAFGQKTGCPGMHGIIVLDPVTGQHHELVGKDAGFADGDATTARFSEPAEIALDWQSGLLYVTEPRNHRIRQVTPTGGVTTLAGSGQPGSQDGSGAAASFNYSEGITYCPNDRNLYVADTDNNEIRRVTTQGVVTTLAGSLDSGYADGPLASARFNHPSGIVCDGAGNLYVADRDNNMIREISVAGTVSTLAGSTEAGTLDGVGSAARFSHPGDLTFDAATGALYVVDFDSNDIRKVTTASRAVAGSP